MTHTKRISGLLLALSAALIQPAAAQSVADSDQKQAAAGTMATDAGPQDGSAGTDPAAEAEAEAEAVEQIILPAEGVTLEEFHWIKRPILVFADSPADPRYIEQMGLITARLDELRERDVVVITDTDPGNLSAVRKKLRPRGFMLALVGKDGTVYLRKPFPWDVRELSRSIDKMPMRQQEIRDRRENLLE